MALLCWVTLAFFAIAQSAPVRQDGWDPNTISKILAANNGSANFPPLPPSTHGASIVCPSDFHGQNQYSSVLSAITVSEHYASKALEAIQFGPFIASYKAFFKSASAHAKLSSTYTAASTLPQLPNGEHPYFICINDDEDTKRWAVSDAAYAVCLQNGFYYNRRTSTFGTPSFGMLICQKWYTEYPNDDQSPNSSLCPSVRGNIFSGVKAWPWTKATLLSSLLMTFYGELRQDPAAGRLDFNAVPGLNRAMAYTPDVASGSLLSNFAFAMSRLPLFCYD